MSTASIHSTRMTPPRDDVAIGTPPASTFLSQAVLVLLCCAAAMNPIQIIVPDAVVERGIGGPEPITLVKLAIAALAVTVGVWGVFRSWAVRQLLGKLTGSLLILLAGAFVVTSIFAFADAATISRAASLIFLSYVLFVAVAVTIVDLRAIVAAMTIGSIVFLLTTWAIYLTMPSIGKFVEYTDQFNTVVRMGGTAHPNGIARDACIMLVMCGCFLRPGSWTERRPMVRFALWLAVVLGLATLAQTMSRTAIAAGSIAMVALLWDRLWTRAGILSMLSGAAIALTVFLAGLIGSRDQSGGDRIAAHLTKSGSLEEITSLTGRTEIWTEAIGFIAQRPITGWGLDSAASLMNDHAMGTHNLLLHVFFSGGIFSALILIGLLIATVVVACTSSQPLFRAITAYIFVSAILEDTLVESFPTGLTILWFVLLLQPSAVAIRNASSPTLTRADTDAQTHPFPHQSQPSFGSRA